MRRVLLSLLFLLGFLAVLAAGLLLVRREAAEVLITYALYEEGIERADFQVVALDKGYARVEEVTLGRFRHIHARAIEVELQGMASWNPLAWRPEIAEVRIAGLRLPLDGDAPSGLLDDPALDRLLAGSAADSSEAPAALPRIVLEDARVDLRSGGSHSALALSGSLERPPGQDLAGRFDYALSTEAGEARGVFEVLQGAGGPLKLSLSADEAGLQLAGRDRVRLSGDVTATISEEALPQVTGRVEIADIGPITGTFDAATLAFVADPSRVDLTVTASAAGSPVGKAALKITRLDTRPQIAGTLDFDATQLSSKLGLAGSEGRLTLAGQVDARLPPLTELTAGAAPLDRLLAEAELTSDLTVRARSLSLPERLHGLDAELHLRAALAGGRLTLVVPKLSTVKIAALEPTWPLLAALPEDTRQAVWQDLSLTVPAVAGQGLRLTAEQSAAGLDLALEGPLILRAGSDTRLRYGGSVEALLSPALVPLSIRAEDLAVSLSDLPVMGYRIGTLDLGGSVTASGQSAQGKLTLVASLPEAAAGELELYDLALRLPVEIQASEAGARLDLWGTGHVELEQAVLGLDTLLPEPAALRLESGHLALAASGAWEQALSAKAERLRLLLPGGERLDLDALTLGAEGGAEAGAGYVGKARLAAASLAMPEAGLSLGSLRVEVPLPPDRLAQTPGRVRVASAAVAAEGTRLGGMSFDGVLSSKAGRYRLDGSGKGPAGQAGLSLALAYDPEAESGSLTAKWGPILFAPDGLQPKTLLPALAEAEKVSGSMRLEAEASWSPEGGSQSARLVLSDLDATLAPLVVEGLDADLRFRSLLPLESAPEQLIEIDRLTAGVPLEQVLATFQVVDAAGGPAVAVERLQADFSGGRLLASPFRVDARGSPFRTSVELVHLKLDRLSEILDLGEIQLSGRVIGQMPLAIDPAAGTVAIENGWLQAADKGVIRIPDAAARLGLGDVSGQQKEFLFALEALNDFRYTYLYGKVSFGAQGALDLALTLEGNNPAVQEGYPFKFNITFSVDLGEVLEAVRRGRTLTPQLFDGAWSLK